MGILRMDELNFHYEVSQFIVIKSAILYISCKSNTVNISDKFAAKVFIRLEHSINKRLMESENVLFFRIQKTLKTNVLLSHVWNHFIELSDYASKSTVTIASNCIYFKIKRRQIFLNSFR